MLKVTANAAAFPNDVDTGVPTIQVPENVTSTLHYSFIYTPYYRDRDHSSIVTVIE